MNDKIEDTLPENTYNTPAFMSRSQSIEARRYDVFQRYW